MSYPAIIGIFLLAIGVVGSLFAPLILRAVVPKGNSPVSAEKQKKVALWGTLCVFWFILIIAFIGAVVTHG